MKLLVKSNSYDFLYLLHLWLVFITFTLGITFMVDFYYIYGQSYFSWLIITFMVDFYYIYGQSYFSWLLITFMVDFYYTYGQSYFSWLIITFMVDFYYIYGQCYFSWLIITFMGDTASQLGAGDLIGSQCSQKGVYEIYI